MRKITLSHGENAVQRTFAAAGFGCIATGVPAAGTVRTGDELELLPAGRRVRVRAIEISYNFV